MRVLSSKDVLIKVRIIENMVGIILHREPKINGIPIAVTILSWKIKIIQYN
jgi:hypothetical protein